MLPSSPVKQQSVCGGCISPSGAKISTVTDTHQSSVMVNSADVAHSSDTAPVVNGDPYSFVDPENDTNISVLPAQHRLAKNRKLANVRHGSLDSSSEPSTANNELGSTNAPVMNSISQSTARLQTVNTGPRLPNGPVSTNNSARSTGCAVQYSANGQGSFVPQTTVTHSDPKISGHGGHFIALPPPPPIPSPPQNQASSQPNDSSGRTWPSPQHCVPVMMQNEQKNPNFHLPITAYEHRQQNAQHSRQFFIQSDQQDTASRLMPQQAVTPTLATPRKSEPKEVGSASKRKMSAVPLTPQQNIGSILPQKQLLIHAGFPEPPVLPVEEIIDQKIPILARVSHVGSRLPVSIGKERPATRNKGIIQQCNARVYFPSEAAFMAYAYWASRRMFHSDILGRSDNGEDELNEGDSLLFDNRSPVVEDVDTEIAEMPMRSDWFMSDEELCIPVSSSAKLQDDESSLKAMENRRAAIDQLRTSLKQAVVLRRAAFKTNTMPRGHNALEAQQLAQLFAEDRRLLYRLLHRTRISAPDRSLVKRLLRKAGNAEAFQPQQKKQCACDVPPDSGISPTQNAQNCQRCQNPALPFANHCPLHITYSVDQKLFEQCSGRPVCHRATCDLRRSKAPLCQEHAVVSGVNTLDAVGGGGNNTAESGNIQADSAPAKNKKKRNRTRKKPVSNSGDSKPSMSESASASGLNSSFGSPNTSQTQGNSATAGFGSTGTGESATHSLNTDTDFNDILNTGNETNSADLGSDMHLFDDDMIEMIGDISTQDIQGILQDSQNDGQNPEMADPFLTTDVNGSGSSNTQNKPNNQPSTSHDESGSSQQQQIVHAHQPPQYSQPQGQQSNLQSPLSVSSASNRPSNWPALSPSQQTQSQVSLQSPGSNFPQQHFGMMPPPWSPTGIVQQAPPSQLQQQQQEFPPPSPQRSHPLTPQGMASPGFYQNQSGATTPQAQPQHNLNGFVSPGPHQNASFPHNAFPPPQQQAQQQPVHHQQLLKSQSLNPAQMNGPMSQANHQISQPTFAGQQQFQQPGLHRTFSHPQQQQQQSHQMEMAQQQQHMQAMQSRVHPHFSSPMHQQQQQQNYAAVAQSQAAFQSAQQAQFQQQQQQNWMQQQQQQHQQQQMYFAGQNQQYMPPMQQTQPPFGGPQMMHHHAPPNRSMYQQ